ncbi:SLATT domain-containing protein [Brevundimonas naejangsanensis]|uniref:SLATT domain-containing protein n=1 Tax=Brevundimonas naejangsanensis TaxID=588932 RepID=UPI00320B16F6
MYDDIFKTYPLLTTMSKLRAARFTASERLGKKYRWHSIALVVFSIYAIALTIAPNFFTNIDESIKSILSYASVVSSVFVVALSMYLAFSEDIVRGKYLHDNAKQVTNLYQELKTRSILQKTKPKVKINIVDYESRYARIMDSCPYNHDILDYEFSMMTNEGADSCKSFGIKFRMSMDKYAWPLVAIIAPPIVLMICIAINLNMN